MKTTSKNLKAFTIIFLLVLLPYFVILLSTRNSLEEYGRLLVVFFFILLLPIWIIWYSLRKSNTKEWEFYFWKKKIKPGRIFLFIVGIGFIYYLSIPFVYDLRYIANQGISIKEGIVTNAYTPGFGILLKYETFKFQSDETYTSIYSNEYIKNDEKVKIWYLPNSKFLLRVDKL